MLHNAAFHPWADPEKFCKGGPKLDSWGGDLVVIFIEGKSPPPPPYNHCGPRSALDYNAFIGDFANGPCFVMFYLD